MNRLRIAFDVDDTLIVPAVATGFERDVPNYETIAVYRWLQAQGHEMVIWSGGGDDYARQWAEKLGLEADHYLDKGQANHDGWANTVDLAFDDSDLTLARVNVKVRRHNNKVIRYPERIAAKKARADGLEQTCLGCSERISDCEARAVCSFARTRSVAEEL